MAPRKTTTPASPVSASKSLPTISDAEWVVMREFWKRERGTVADIVQSLEGHMHWKPRTVQSLINRVFPERDHE